MVVIRQEERNVQSHVELSGVQLPKDGGKQCISGMRNLLEMCERERK